MVQKYDSYIICATPRSGSTLLCDLLTGSGIAGQPDSFFRHESFLWWADYLKVSTVNWSAEHQFDQAYLSAVREYGSNGTHIFGMRLMWESVAGLSTKLKAFYPALTSDSSRFRAAFGNPLYLHLYREDKIAQAVSRLRAEQTGLWHRYSDGTERERLKRGEEPFYDRERLSQLKATLEEHEAAWAAWFALQNITPMRITYEQLSAEPKAMSASVLGALPLDHDKAAAASPKSAKMADQISTEWADRFRAESIGSDTTKS